MFRVDICSDCVAVSIIGLNIKIHEYTITKKQVFLDVLISLYELKLK